MYVELRETITQRSKGDRSRVLADSSCFVVYMIKDGEPPLELSRFDQYDTFHTMISDYARVKQLLRIDRRVGHLERNVAVKKTTI